jgi:hypothetical protein
MRIRLSIAPRSILPPAMVIQHLTRQRTCSMTRLVRGPGRAAVGERSGASRATARVRCSAAARDQGVATRRAHAPCTEPRHGARSISHSRR